MMTANTVLQWLGVEGYEYKGVAFSSPLPAVALAICIILAAALAIYLYSRESSLSPAKRIGLGLCRAVIYAVLLVMLFGPIMELERKNTLSRNLLVLVDRSASMNIVDKRVAGEEVADGAMAMGKTPYVLPGVQESLATALRLARRTSDRLGQSRPAEALAPSRETVAALEESAKLCRQTGMTGPDQAAAGQFQGRLQSLAQRQKGLDATLQKLEKEGGLTTVRCPELRGVQEPIIKDIEAAATAFAKIIPAPSAAATPESVSQPRIALAKSMLTSILPSLASQCNVKLYAFGEKNESISSVESKDGSAAVEKAKGLLGAVQAADKKSRGAVAIRDMINEYSGQPMAGVVVLTDGAFNEESDDPQEVAAWLKDQDVPLFVTGIGLQAPQDVGVRSLIVADAVFPKDIVTARVQVFSHGYRDTSVDVLLKLDGQELARAAVTLTDQPRFVDVPFTVPEGRGATAKLSVSIDPRKEEASVANNIIERPIKIINQKIKVLYVEGKPRWEYRYLRVVLLRDPRLDVKFLMTQGDPDLAAASPQYISRFPDTDEEAFAYDLIILGEVQEWFFNRPQQERIVDLVRKRGGSLLVLAGERYMPSSYYGKPLAEALPVKITRDFISNIPKDLSAIVTPAGKRSFTMVEADDKGNDLVWSLLKSLHRLPRLEGAKPAANVLVELPATEHGAGAYPLIAWQYFGTGKSMFVGTDQLWRMRYKLGDRYHAKFWGQAIQFLALSRLLGENKRIHITVERPEFRAGETVSIITNVLDDSFAPSMAKRYVIYRDTVAVDEKAPNAQKAVLETKEIELTPVANSPGLFQGSMRLEKQGTYQLRAGGQDSRFANSVDIVATATDYEQLEPAMQETLLRKMADLSGGRYLTVREWPALAGLLESKGRTIIERKPKDLWDFWPVYVMLVLLAGSEWYLRRRYHLV
ncbi:MAG: hypothetical protein ABFD92_19370 [Planctomycetaceae bacterium]|nr:hypothetical protein [Planctomycetaceae bacterium]